jgi:hypothetical protein
MKIQLFALAALAVGSAALAVPVRPVVAPGEVMVKVPGLERLGPSRISSVRFCAKLTGVADWRQLVTDSELEGMDRCLRDLT